MNMTRAEKDLVALHKRALEIYPGWPCNCCGQVFWKGQGSPLIDVFRPPRGIRLTTKQCAATFVICGECQKLPDSQISKGVLAGFIQRKLAVPVGV